MSTLHRHCASLFDGTSTQPEPDQILVIENGLITYAGHRNQAPAARPHDGQQNAGFVMPGLIDVHTHLAFGNAQSEEDIDI